MHFQYRRSIDVILALTAIATARRPYFIETVLILKQSYGTRNVLVKTIRMMLNFLTFKDSLSITLRCSPLGAVHCHALIWNSFVPQMEQIMFQLSTNLVRVVGCLQIRRTTDRRRTSHRLHHQLICHVSLLPLALIVKYVHASLTPVVNVTHFPNQIYTRQRHTGPSMRLRGWGLGCGRDGASFPRRHSSTLNLKLSDAAAHSRCM